ncbi:D-alanyl-D-alanine carboxypeptidase family protein [Actinomadura graeca]|uniref:D-alanyl-D-alanine carboxypeptidase family protein n=1 Tax=Actinomadura graeca TaxID=2750812 RepID=UPI001E33717D|nr:D-alanyl-D-alanine carboxypeptidase [Actinomadura graeca]
MRPERHGLRSGLRRTVTVITVPVAAICLTAPPALSAPPGRVAPPSDPVGGPQLASRGLVVDTTAGIPALPKVNASSYLVADGDTGEVLAAKDPHGQYLPASTLKTLTALALVPRLDPDRLVRPSQRACDVEGTKVGLTPKMQYKVSDLFHALMMMSANDAAVTLAEADGGMRKTLADMNAEARRINARDTLAGSPNGLDKDLGLNVRTQHTSAYDLALILREGLKNADYRRYVQAIDFDFPAPPSKKERKKGKKVGGYPIHTHNKLLPGERYGYTGLLGGKNGYTIAAGQTYVAAARRDGHTIIISLMKADMPPSPYAVKLLDWGFTARGKAKPVGALVPPGDAPDPKDGPGGLLPDAPLASDDSTRMWLLVGGGAVGAVLATGVLIAVLRRRRRYGPPPARPAEPSYDDSGR